MEMGKMEIIYLSLREEGMEMGKVGDYIPIATGRGYGDGESRRLYTYRYAVTTRMTPALRWAAMRAILMFHNCEGKSHKTVSRDHNF